MSRSTFPQLYCRTTSVLLLCKYLSICSTLVALKPVAPPASFHLQDWLGRLKVNVPPDAQMMGLGTTAQGGTCDNFRVPSFSIIPSYDAKNRTSYGLALAVSGVEAGCQIPLKRGGEGGAKLSSSLSSVEAFTMHLSVKSGRVSLDVRVENAEPFPGAGKLFPHSVAVTACNFVPNIEKLWFTGENATLVEELNKVEAPML
ncbi:unnamed protein product [Amoebophrya sp. A25]|nr:unnamed protein product [Amoebophrya sp. A25]|eukprot:GSA25T00014879001.1